jgi:hypothetical protein
MYKKGDKNVPEKSKCMMKIMKQKSAI